MKLLQTFVYKFICENKFPFFLEYMPKNAIGGHMQFLVLKGLLRVAVLFHIPTSSVWKSGVFPTFHFSRSDRCKVISASLSLYFSKG